MKKVTLIILALFILSTPVYAESAVGKLSRGVEGIVTSPIAYVNQFHAANNDENIIPTVFYTVIGGTVKTVKRVLNGAVDIVTFPFGDPEYNQLFDDHHDTALDAYQNMQGKEILPLGGF